MSNGLIAYPLSESGSASSNSRRRAAHSASDSTSLERGNAVLIEVGWAVRREVRFRQYSTSWNTSLNVSDEIDGRLEGVHTRRSGRWKGIWL